MAIRILLDHGVKEDRIIFVTFLVARGGGVSVLRRAFPKVRIVCGAVDDEMREGWLEGYQDLENPEGHGRKVWSMQPGMDLCLWNTVEITFEESSINQLGYISHIPTTRRSGMQHGSLSFHDFFPL
jgi:hypothetical protein